MNRPILTFLTSSFFAVSLTLLATEPANEDTVFSTKLISAVENADYETFTADGTEEFRAMKKEQFKKISSQLGPKLKTRSELSYLGELKQRGFHVTLWKLTFKDGSDDSLVTLSMKDGKVGGFFIR